MVGREEKKREEQKRKSKKQRKKEHDRALFTGSVPWLSSPQFLNFNLI